MRHVVQHAQIRFLALFTAMFFVLPSIAHGQSTLKIAAVVNDEIISVFDLSQRVNLVITFSNLPANQQVRQRIAPEVLRRLIVEKLHFQEAERLGVEIPDERIDAVVAGMEQSRNLPSGGMVNYLGRRGIDIETLRDQIRARESWVSTVARLYRGTVNISDVEVEDILERNKARAGQPEYLLFEIFLDFNAGARAEVIGNAQRIIQQIQRGASFEQLAQNFSESSSAARGGALGWVMADDLEPEVVARVQSMQEGSLSDPISTSDGVHIVSLRGKRIAKGIEAAQSDPTLELQQIHFAIPPGTPAAVENQTIARLNALRQQIASCEALSAAAETEGSPLSGVLGTFKLSQLNADFQNSVRDLPENGISAPIRTADGAILLMVCSRTEEDTGDPVEQAKQDIRTRLLNERLSQLAKQHEEKIRREAFIEFRI